MEVVGIHGIVVCSFCSRKCVYYLDPELFYKKGWEKEGLQWLKKHHKNMLLCAGLLPKYFLVDCYVCKIKKCSSCEQNNSGEMICKKCEYNMSIKMELNRETRKYFSKQKLDAIYTFLLIRQQWKQNVDRKSQIPAILWITKFVKYL